MSVVLNISLLNLETALGALKSCLVTSAGGAAHARLRVGQVVSGSSHRIVDRLGTPGLRRMLLAACLQAAVVKHGTRRSRP